jgi:hypothetical protein
MSGPTKQRAIDALERRLLEAARLERPDSRSHRRALLALAGGAALGSATASSAAATLGAAGSASGTGTMAAASGAGAAAPSGAAAAAGATALGGAKAVVGAATLIGVAKAVAIGAISGVVVLGAAQRIQQPEPARPAPRATVAAEIERPLPRPLEPARAARPAAPAVDVGADERVVDVSPATAPADQPAPAQPPRVEKKVAPKPAPIAAAARVEPIEVPAATNDAPRATASLSEEVAMLDRARDALMRRDPIQALGILDAYERAKVGSTLSAEAALLRIEALVQRGETARAAWLAEEFLRAHPQSPVADRMRSIIQAAPR